MTRELTDVAINDSDEADVSTYETGATSGKLRIHLNAIAKYADCQSEAAVALGLHRNDASTQRRIVTTFPTEVFSDDRTETGGEVLTMSNIYRLPAHSGSGVSIDTLEKQVMILPQRLRS